MHENSTISANRLSWASVFEWAQLISAGKEVYVAGELPDCVLAFSVEDEEKAHSK